MSAIVVTGNTLSFNGKDYRCAVGKNGFSSNKKEGDGCTPYGTFALRECWYRMEKMDAPQTGLALKIITAEDGWCDDALSPDYNKHVALPFEASHEKLFRDDDRYDLIIPLGYNDDPIVPGLGSAIFMHVAAVDYSGTEGCVALDKSDLLEILRDVDEATTISILPQ